MHSILWISDAISRFVVRIGKIAAWAGLALILVTVFDVIMRQFSQSEWGLLRELVARQQDWFGSTKLQELEWHIHTVLFALCLGFAYLQNQHVRIDLVRERLSPRVQWWIEIIGVVVFLLPYCLLVIYFSVDFVERSFMQNETSASATGLANRWMIKAVLPAGFILLALSGVAVLLRKIAYLFGPPGLADRPRV
jgi:TRAP-type mannitol/chloroaromatic compound transport system permease small subunit